MKMFLLVAGDSFYPESRTGNWIDTFETEEAARAEISEVSRGWHNDGVEIRGTIYDWHDIIDLNDWVNRK